MHSSLTPRERLVAHVQTLERLQAAKQEASHELTEAFERAKAGGYDPTTLKVVLKLRKMTPEQRRERRALEAIYMAALGMLEGDPLPDEARRRLDGKPKDPPPAPPATGEGEMQPPLEGTAPPEPEQPPLIVKDPAEARQEGVDAAAAGARIYDNPYPAGDPCRAAWDEGWCAQSKSHGMDTPAAFQRRNPKAPEKDDKPGPPKKGGDDDGDQPDAGEDQE